MKIFKIYLFVIRNFLGFNNFVRARKISYRLWGEYQGHTFDLTPYFRHYYYRHIPREIPPLDIKERNYYAGV